MNRLYASLDREHTLYNLRRIGDYAIDINDNTVIGINQANIQEINNLEAELKKLDIVILRLDFVEKFIEYTIFLNWNQYRPFFN